MDPRVVILEILNTDRYRNYRGQAFPLLVPFLTDHGVHTQWLSVGVMTKEAQGGGNLYLYDLPTDDVATVFNRLESIGVTHLLLNERVSDDLWRRLKARFPATRILMADSHSSKALFDQVTEWIGLDVDTFRDRALPEDLIEPSFERTPLNSLALEVKPYVHLVLGPECVYVRSLTANAHYDGIDLSDCVRNRGCSFCMYPEALDTLMPSTRPVDLALRQIEAAEATVPTGFRSREYQVHGMNLWFNIAGFAKALSRTNVPGSAFHFSSRIDELLRVAEDLEIALPLLEAGGHSICLYNLGIENFSTLENERFNKGLTLEQIEQGLGVLRDLEERFPKAFLFSSMGGFGFILFTPWTRFADLRINLDAFKRHGIDISGFILDTAVQLLPDLAITRLAQRDGLILSDFEDFRYDSGCITNWDQTELPWRFAEEGMMMLYRIARRLSRVADIPPNENNYVLVQRWLGGLPEKVRDATTVFTALIEVMERAPAEASIVAVLAAIERQLGVEGAFDLAAVDEARLQSEEPLFDTTPEDAPSFWEFMGESLERAFERSEKARSLLRGFSPQGIRLKRHADHFGLEFDLSDDERSLRLFIEQDSEDRPRFLEGARFILSYSLLEGSPVDESCEMMMRGVLALFERIHQRLDISDAKTH